MVFLALACFTFQSARFEEKCGNSNSSFASYQPKIQGKEQEEDELLDWLFFLDDHESERAKKSMEENKTIQEATKELERLQADEEMQRLALSRWIALSDYNTNMSAMKKEGRIEEKKETAKKLLEKKMSIDFIIEITGLTEEEIKALQ